MRTRCGISRGPAGNVYPKLTGSETSFYADGFRVRLVISDRVAIGALEQSVEIATPLVIGDLSFMAVQRARCADFQTGAQQNVQAILSLIDPQPLGSGHLPATSRDLSY